MNIVFMSIHATRSDNLNRRVKQFSQTKNIIFMFLNVFTINVFSGCFAIRQIHPCFRLERNQICSVQNRYSINSHFPLLQELIVIIIQKDCRQARYILIHWQRCQYCIIWKLNCIQFSSEQFDHCWITV